MLEFKNVTKTFNIGTVNERTALNDISITLPKGDFVTLVGSNGGGKSSLMNVISGVYLADSGSITLDGRDITFLPEHKRSRDIGRLFQDPMKGTAPNMTIAENLFLAYGRARRLGFRIGVGKNLTSLFQERLALLDLGLEDRLRTKMGLLSGGQRQAITLLMATICTPKLLMLDEHTAALDPATADKVLKLTEAIIKEEKITTIMITHDMHQALELGNRTLMIENGKIIQDLSGPEREAMTVDKLVGMFK